MANKFNISNLVVSRRHFYLFAGVIFIILAFMASGAAVNIDELLHYNHAKKVVNWYVSGGEDVSCFDTPKTHLKYYGQSIDNISAFVNRAFSIDNEYLTRHYIGLITGFILVLLTGLVAFEVSGNYLVGILAMILLIVSPRPMGQMFGNLKDIPFALGYIWAIYSLIRIIKQLPKPSWKTIISFALAIAFTNSVRIGGLVLYFYLGLFFLIWLRVHYSNQKNEIHSLKFWIDIKIKGISILLIGYFLGLILWPYGLVNPIKNPIEALQVMEHYKISIKQIFEGDVIWSTLTPWYYLPKWLLISIPEIVIVGIVCFAIYLKKILKKKNSIQFGILSFAILFPVVYVIAINSNLYSGWRQMYFIYPPLIILSTIGIHFILTKLSGKRLALATAVVTILVAFPIVHTVQTYPSEYIYFNSIAGFNKKAWSDYEYDYYWHEMKKGADWLEQEIEGNDNQITIATNLKLQPYLFDSENVEFEYVHYYDKISVDWDYAILGANYIHPWQLKNNTWQYKNVIKTFYHKGNPTVVVLKSQDKNAYEGYKAFQDKDYKLAKLLLEKAIVKDPNDLNINAYLGESCLADGLIEEAWDVAESGKNIHPFYEPFLLTQAKVKMLDGEYEEGLKILKDLTKVNPRFFKALPYLIECFEKTGQTDMAKKLRQKYNV